MANREYTVVVNNWGELEEILQSKGIDTTGMSYADMIDAINQLYLIDNEDKTITPSTVQQTFSPVSPYTGFGDIVVEPYTLESKNVTPSTVQQTITPDNANGLSSVVVAGDENLITNNIKKDISIFGVVGNYDPQPTLEQITITPSISQQVIVPSSGNDGIDEVTVEAVDHTIDSDILASNIKQGVDILGVTGSLIPVEKDLIDIENLATPPDYDYTMAVCEYNGKLQLFLDSKHFEYDIETDTWSTVATGVSILGYNYYGRASALFNCAFLIGNKLTTLKTIATASGYNYVTIREYDMTSHTAADRAGGSGSVTADYPYAYTLHDGYIWASCKINNVPVIIKIDLNTLTYTVVVTNTTKYYEQIEFVGDTLYGINSSNGLDIIDVVNNSITNILTLTGDNRNLMTTSDGLFVMGNDSNYLNIYKLENNTLTLYFTGTGTNRLRSSIYFNYNGVVYQFTNKEYALNYGSHPMRKIGNKFYREITVAYTSGLVIDTEYITKVTLI